MRKNDAAAANQSIALVRLILKSVYAIQLLAANCHLATNSIIIKSATKRRLQRRLLLNEAFLAFNA